MRVGKRKISGDDLSACPRRVAAIADSTASRSAATSVGRSRQERFVHRRRHAASTSMSPMKSASKKASLMIQVPEAGETQSGRHAGRLRHQGPRRRSDRSQGQRRSPSTSLEGLRKANIGEVEMDAAAFRRRLCRLPTSSTPKPAKSSSKRITRSRRRSCRRSSKTASRVSRSSSRNATMSASSSRRR